MKKSTEIPREATNPAIAAALGLSERRIAAVRGEGRLPTAPSGQIDLHALLRRGWGACLTAPRGKAPALPPSAAKALAPALMGCDDAISQAIVLALLAALEAAPVCAALAAADAGCDQRQAAHIGNVALVALWRELNEFVGELDIPAIEAPGSVAQWAESVNWPALFGKAAPAAAKPQKQRSRRAAN